MEYGEAVGEFEEFFSEEYYEDVAEAVHNGEESIIVDIEEMDIFNIELYDYLRDNPGKAVSAAEEGVIGHDQITDEELNIRFTNMPEEDFVLLKNLRSQHIGKFIPIEGMIKRASQVKPEVVSAVFECNQCGELVEKDQDSAELKSPYKCPDCGSRKFDVEEKVMTDSQVITVEENPESRDGSEQPSELKIKLEGDLVDPDFQRKVVPGNVAEITGVIVERQLKKNSKKYDMYMEANYLNPTQQEFEQLVLSEEEKEEIRELSKDPEIFNRIAQSIAPSIFGHDRIKQAIALQLFGGVKKGREDGVKSRGDIHILLIGEPGTGKSQLLKFTGELAPKGRYVVGKSSTGAGLCVTGDTLIHTEDGFKEIGEIGRKEIPFEPTEETAKEYELNLPTFSKKQIENRKSSHVWRMPEKNCFKATTVYGKEIEASQNTDVLTCGENGVKWKKISQLKEGDFVAAPEYEGVERRNPEPQEYYSFENEKFKLSSDSSEELREKMSEKYGDLRQAAAELELSEDFVYTSIRKRFVPHKRLDFLLDELNIDFDEIEAEKLMLQNGEEFVLPKKFDEDLMYLIGFVFGDGKISIEDQRGLVRISNSNKDMLRNLQDIVKDKFDKKVEIEEQEERVPYIRIYSKTIASFFENLGMCSPKEGLKLDSKLTTAENADAFLRGLFDADGSVVSRDNGSDSIQYSTISHKLADQVQLMLETYGTKSKKRTRDRRGIEKLENGQEIESKSIQKHLVIRGSNIDKFSEKIGFNSEKKTESLREIKGKKRNANLNVAPVNKILQNSKAQTGDHWTYFNQEKNPGQERLQNIIKDVKLEQEIEEKVEEVVNSEINWEQVKQVKETGEKELYDLTVPETHNFIGNGIITHNTAAVVRDESTGEFELEAGAVVLANKGMAAIDEIDKMGEEDRSSLHEAMEQQQISVSKANIQATLNAQTSILAAGNPKYGRFDPYEPIPQQIAIGDTLLSRFDFIFPVKDEPDEEKDKQLSDQVLKNHIDPEETDADIDQETLRKYVAYAKQKRPQLTQEAADKIQEFYVNMRSQGGEEGDNIPITARQLEALVRVAEASARAELDDEVTEEDAQRAIDILTYSLEQVGVDPETGEFDIDMVESGVSGSQRNRLQTVKQIIEAETGDDDSVEIQKVLEKANENDIPEDKAEEVIDRLKRDGELFEPEQGKIQRI